MHKTGGTTTYRYDGDGRRVERKFGTTTTRYVYDGDDEIAECNGSNAIQLYRLAGIGYIEGTLQRYTQENALGSALAVRDSAGALLSRTEYDAYGLDYVISSGSRSDYRFAAKHGYVTDDDTGMQLLGARYYLPRIGRFLTQDPIGHEGGLNLYANCENSPLVSVDPKGKKGVTIGGFEFTWEMVGTDLQISGAALGSNLSFGLWDGGEWRKMAGFCESQVCWAVAEAAGTGAYGLSKAAARRATGDVVVYLGRQGKDVVYVGITNDIARRGLNTEPALQFGR